jgi:hypothetical protein
MTAPVFLKRNLTHPILLVAVLFGTCPIRSACVSILNFETVVTVKRVRGESTNSSILGVMARTKRSTWSLVILRLGKKQVSDILIDLNKTYDDEKSDFNLGMRNNSTAFLISYKDFVPG